MPSVSSLKKNKYPLGFYICFIIVLSLLFGSRSFLIGAFTAITILIFISINGKVSRRLQYCLLVIPIIALPVVSIFIKVDSSKGRLLIYKVSTEIAKDHYFHGVGIHNFPNYYCHYQEVYFERGDFTQSELLLADSVNFVYNDYFQLFIELGLIGIAICLCFLWLVWKTVDTVKSHLHNNLMTITVFNIITIAVAALFTHVFDVNYFQLAFGCSLLIFWGFVLGLQKLRHTIIVVGFVVGVTTFHSYDRILLHREYSNMKEAKTLFKQEFYGEADSICKLLYPAFNGNEQFLDLYSQALFYNYKVGQSKRILKRLIAIRDSYVLQRRLALCYLDERNIREAENALKRSINMVPNRFLSRYDLFNLYFDNKQYALAQTVALAIIKLPVKVPSPIIRKIKQETSQKLLTLNKLSLR
ncbi:MAG TPA: O-antigen ligase family protein [Pedobacter sp.]|uniref:O-antigen ligase family protein n=1 Tax=Pedobacter sp. TaxID=1411316 RepID=UPI002C2766CE|nr:O-antigen ligase family protein [Pedobacter sp.]HMI02504.1 O-antigen ligase family protein [Pedobacter sp.]